MRYELVTMYGERFAPRYGESRAVIIGIDEYQGQGFGPLLSARADAKAIAEVLRTRFGFPQEHMACLYNGEATGTAIRKAVQRLGDGDVDDRAIVYFAGHGHTHPRGDGGGW